MGAPFLLQSIQMALGDRDILCVKHHSCGVYVQTGLAALPPPILFQSNVV